MTEKLDLIQALGLGLIQGITEFLPISSDGHLALGQAWFHIEENNLELTIFLHLGTLIATAFVFRQQLYQFFIEFKNGLKTPKKWSKSESGRMIISVVIASVPTAIIGLMIKDRVEVLSQNLQVVGLGFLCTAMFVASTRWTRNGTSMIPTYHQAIWIGVAQGLAVLPGLSRSGATIAVAMALGIKPQSAFQFSFLLSLPAVFGACLLEMAHPGVLESLQWQTYVGILVAMVSGYLALRILQRIVSQGQFALFAIYLLPLGLALIAIPFR